MAKLKLDFHVLIFFCSSLLISISTTQSNNLSSQDHKKVALFIFGDSLIDPGNNNYINTSFRANFWPYGETFFKYPTGRFSDGRIIPDFIAEFLKLPLIPAYLDPKNHVFLNGANFASGGAGALVETLQGQVIDLKTQLYYFKKVEKKLRQKLGDKNTRALLSKSIYLISIGGNDYIQADPTINKKNYVGMVIGNLTNTIKEIYASGGRKFGILSIGTVDYIPVIRAIEENSSTSGITEKISSFVKLHNNALPNELKKLQTQLQGFKYSYSDIYTSGLYTINNPRKYGFKESKEACCGYGPYRGTGCGINKKYELCKNPSEYLFFDGDHPTEKFNFLLAELIWNGNKEFTMPYGLKTLVEEE